MFLIGFTTAVIQTVTVCVSVYIYIHSLSRYNIIPLFVKVILHDFGYESLCFIYNVFRSKTILVCGKFSFFKICDIMMMSQ